MGRRADPLRVYAAQRAGVQRRLVEAFAFTPERAEAAIAGWEREAARAGVGRLESGYWTAAEAWLLGGRGSGEAVVERDRQG